MSSLRNSLVQLLKEKALSKKDEAIQLASGEWSNDFIDGKEGLQQWNDLALAARAIHETVSAAGIEFDASGGLTLGANHLAVAMAFATEGRWFVVRKEPKERGTKRHIEGAQIGEGDQVLLVDDVVTSGGSIMRAYELVSETGAVVVAAVTLVDRGDLARSEFERIGVPYFPMATYQDLGINPVGLSAISA